jgi:hypothetical protein
VAGAAGRPFQADDVAGPQQRLPVLDVNDCHYIANTIASAAGASLPTLSYAFNPAQNQAGVWPVPPAAHSRRTMSPGRSSACQFWSGLSEPRWATRQ